MPYSESVALECFLLKGVSEFGIRASVSEFCFREPQPQLKDVPVMQSEK